MEDGGIANGAACEALFAISKFCVQEGEGRGSGGGERGRGRGGGKVRVCSSLNENIVNQKNNCTKYISSYH
jgi:hypothetical protein